MRSLLTENFYAFMVRHLGDTVHHVFLLLHEKDGNEINVS